MNTHPSPYLLGPEDGEAFWGFGSLWTVKASAEQTSGKFALIEEVSPAGAGTPLHRHPEDDETFYVLESEISFYRKPGDVRSGHPLLKVRDARKQSLPTTFGVPRVEVGWLSTRTWNRDRVA